MGARIGSLGDRAGSKEGGATGRNRGKAGSGMAGRVDTGSGQQKAPRGNLGVSGEGVADYRPPLPARALRAIKATNRAASKR